MNMVNSGSKVTLEADAPLSTVLRNYTQVNLTKYVSHNFIFKMKKSNLFVKWHTHTKKNSNNVFRKCEKRF